MEAYEKAAELFNEHRESMRALGIRDPSHLVGLMVFIRLIMRDSAEKEASI